MVAVGAELPGARVAIRYPDDGDREVARHTEVLVAEQLAAASWGQQG